MVVSKVVAFKKMKNFRKGIWLSEKRESVSYECGEAQLNSRAVPVFGTILK